MERRERGFAEWLLPGVGAVPEDSVIALETNPRFVDALLVGLNTQLLAELRWRNIPVATGCTPLRGVLERPRHRTGDRVATSAASSPGRTASELGTQRTAPRAHGRDLVIVSRGQLFLRYPATVVYLYRRAGGGPDFDQDPTGRRAARAARRSRGGSAPT